MLDELRRVSVFTTGVAELTRHRAEQLVKDLVRSGDVRRERASDAVRELLSLARDNRREVLALLRNEVESQMESLGLVRRRDLERLERRITRLEERAASTSARSPAGKTSRSSGTGGSSKGGAARRSSKKTPARKSPKKTAARSSSKKATT